MAAYPTVNKCYLKKWKMNPDSESIHEKCTLLATVKSKFVNYKYPYALIDSIIGDFNDESLWGGVHTYLSAIWNERVILNGKAEPEMEPKYTFQEYMDLVHNLKELINKPEYNIINVLSRLDLNTNDKDTLECAINW